MNSIYSHVYLDLQHKAIEPVNLKQYDYEARSILFHITDNGAPYLLADDLLAEVKIHKPDGTKVVARGNVHVGSNEITVNVSRQMTAVYGVLCADITLFREDRLLSTMPFHMHVEKCPIQNEDIDSADEYTLLEDLIALTQKNEALRQANEQVRVQEEQTRTQNEQTRKQNEQTRTREEQARTQNEQARTQNEQARMREEQARTQNEQARSQNEQTRIREEQARIQREAEQKERINTLISDVRDVTQDSADAAADLQRKLDSHHFLLQEDKSVAGGVAALDTNGKMPDGELYVATTSRKGITQLTNSVTSNSTTTAATPSSVKTVYDALVEVGKQKHTHGNKSVLDGITATAIGKWNAAADRADTWRGIQDNLASTSTVDSLSANQGRVLKEMIDNKLSASIPWSKVTGKPGSYPPSAHTHDDRYYTEAEINNLLGGKANNSHSHDNRYYTEAEINSLLGGKANSSHSHDDRYYTEAEVNNLLGGKANNSHSHDDRYYTEAEINNLLGRKANSSHTHSYLPLAGGSLTGTLAIPNLCSIEYGNWKLYSENHQKLKFHPLETEYTMMLGVTDVMWSLAPSRDGAYQLGTPGHRFGNLYAHGGTIQTSDRNIKQDIAPISEEFYRFYSLLQPAIYRFKNGSSGRIHVGFISQDVETAMAESGLSNLDFAGFCKDKKRREVQCRNTRQMIDELGHPLTDENGKPIMEEYEHITYEDELDGDGNPVYIYSLRYEEFIALNTAVIQRQQQKVADLERRLEILETKLCEI